MSPGNDERRPGEGRRIVEQTGKVETDSTRRGRQTPTMMHVIATAIPVVGGTGRHRWLLVVRCLLCGQRHVHHGRGELPPTLQRKAACQRGVLVLHVAGVDDDDEVAA